MPGSHREHVERAYAAFNAGDQEPFMAALHPDAEWHWPPGVADTDVYRGAEEIARAMATWTDFWEFAGDKAVRLRMFGDLHKARRRFLEG